MFQHVCHAVPTNVFLIIFVVMFFSLMKAKIKLNSTNKLKSKTVAFLCFFFYKKCPKLTKRKKGKWTDFKKLWDRLTCRKGYRSEDKNKTERNQTQQTDSNINSLHRTSEKNETS